MKINLKRFLKTYSKIIFIVLVSSGIILNAQDSSEIISKIQDKFKTLKSVKTDFVQEFKNSEGETSSKLKGEYLQAAGGKFRIKTGNGEIISDGITVWNVNKQLERVVISDANDRTNSFSLDKIIYEFPKLCEAKLIEHSGDKYILELLPTENLGFNKATLEVLDNFLVTAVTIEDFNGMLISFELDNYQLDQNIDPDTFKYTPTEGIEIIDLR